VSYATITTLEPLTDVSYIPCVSLLDFWLRSGSLELVVYAHSIDFGKKGFGNLVQVAELQRDVASELNVPVGPLVMIVKSATIYQTELSLMSEMISSAQRAGKKATSASHGVVRLILYCDLALRASVGSHCFCSRIVNALGEIRRRK
jgi:thymidylate synthase